MADVISDENDELNDDNVDYSNNLEYQKLLRKNLMERMEMQERSNQADMIFEPQARKADADTRTRYGLIDVIGRAAAQAGSINGKIADTSALTDNTKYMMQGLDEDVASEKQDKMSRNKLNEYLMGKLLNQEGQVARAQTEQEKMRNEQAMQAKKDRDEAARLAQEKANKDREFALKEKELTLKNQEGPGGKKLTQVPGSVAAELGQFDSATAMADDAFASYMAKASQSGSSLKAQFPGTSANQYEKERNVAAQAIGTILEGGKLTDHDYERYKAMLPAATDTNQIAQTKISAIKNLILQKRKGKIDGLAQTGFDVSNVPLREPTGFSGQAPQPGQAIAAPPAKPKLTPDQKAQQIAQAIKYLQDNPTAEDAPAVREKLKRLKVL